MVSFRGPNLPNFANFKSEIGTHCEFHCVINRKRRHCHVVLKMRIFINERKNKVAAAFDLKILSFTTKQVGYFFPEMSHIRYIFITSCQFQTHSRNNLKLARFENLS